MILMTVFTKFFENLTPSLASPLQQSVGLDYSMRVFLASVDNMNDDDGDVDDGDVEINVTRRRNVDERARESL